MSEIKIGLTNETTRRVEDAHLANVWGSGLAPVLATPTLVLFCEECARAAVDPLLPAGQQTVGARIDVRHLAATPPGLQVTVRAELVEVDGRRLHFQIEVWDDVERVAEAVHERFIIDVERFQARVKQKAEKHAGSTR
jgi:fluoroacetyl-CoA thioesterase